MTLGFTDGEIDASDRAQRLAVVDLVREVRPDLMLTHSPGDYMSDHNEISQLVFDCSFHATLPLLETERRAHDTVTPIYHFDTVMGLGFLPTEYVDVTSTMETKVAMVEAHESQLTWLRDHDDIDIVEQMRTVTRFRGLQCGVEYAEGFVQCLTWPRARRAASFPSDESLDKRTAPELVSRPPRIGSALDDTAIRPPFTTPVTGLVLSAGATESPTSPRFGSNRNLA